MRNRSASESSMRESCTDNRITASDASHKATVPYAFPDVTEESGHPVLRPVVFGTERVFCCHRATLSGSQVPNSLAAVAECVAARVPRLEIDLRFLADDTMAIFHDSDLDHETSATGSIRAQTRESLPEIRHRSSPATGISFLEDVVDVMAGSQTLLQVDLKPLSLLPDRQLEALEQALEPLGDGVIVGSQGHWNLRRLRRVPVAFDPWLQLRYQPARRSTANAPHTLGLHGLWDDSPVAVSPFFGPAEYIETRVADIVSLLPRAVEWMVDIPTILHTASIGVPLGDVLGQHGISLAAWTLSESSGEAGAVLEQIFRAGATTVITDIPLAAAAAAARISPAAA